MYTFVGVTNISTFTSTRSWNSNPKPVALNLKTVTTMATAETFGAPLGYGIVERDLYRSHLGTHTSIESLNSCKSMLGKLGLR